jgi:hypothetical protein
MVPVFIICRDRVSCLRQLVDWLERNGQERIYLIDNQSTYGPMLEYLEQTPHTLVRSEYNTQSSPWQYMMSVMQAEYFVVSDPDVVPTEDCPADALEHFRTLLDAIPDIGKVGFSLRIDDLPDHYVHKRDVIAWESKYWTNIDTIHGVYRSSLDTTFALYRPGEPYRLTGAARTMAPYLARHMAWYLDSADLPEEELYYRAHMGGSISNWNREQLPSALKTPDAP